MNKNIQEMLRLQEESYNLIEKLKKETEANLNKTTQNTKNSIAKITPDIQDLDRLLRTYGLVSLDGRCYRINTHLKAAKCDNTIGESTVCLRFEGNKTCDVRLYKSMSDNSSYGYRGNSWNIIKCEYIAYDADGYVQDYQKDIINLLNNWDKIYPDIEKKIIEDCTATLNRQLKIANTQYERSKSNIY